MNEDEQYLALLRDLIGKLLRFDHHGVCDAANDLRVFEATHPEMVGRFEISGRFEIKKA